MILEKVHNGVRYTFSNENLNIGDETYNLTNGRCTGGDGWVLHNIDYSDFPEEVFIIENLKYSDYKPYEIKTDKGFGPKETYFKIIKKEHKIVTNPDNLFKISEWREFK